MVRTTRNDIAQVRGKRNITFTVSAMTQGQFVSPDIALHISIYCVYCIEDEYLTHNINAQKFFTCWYRPVQTTYIDWYRTSLYTVFGPIYNSEGRVESFQPITCMLYILIFNKLQLHYKTSITITIPFLPEAGGRIGTRFLRPRGTSPLKEANPVGTPGYRNGTESFFGLKRRLSVVRDV
jgi:hypothetical protein